VFVDGDARMVASGFQQGALDLPARLVGIVYDTIARVSSFAPQSQHRVALRVSLHIETRPQFYQPPDLGRPFLHQHAYRIFMAQPCPSVQRVLNVQFKRIFRRQYPRDAALRVVGVGLAALLLGDDHHVRLFCHPQRKSQSRNPTANHDKIGSVSDHVNLFNPRQMVSAFYPTEGAVRLSQW
jgi:hypothetical protein